MKVSANIQPAIDFRKLGDLMGASFNRSKYELSVISRRFKKVFKDKHYPIVLIPDSIAAVIKARNIARKQLSPGNFWDSHAGVNLPDSIAGDRAFNLLARASNLPEPTATKKWLPMPVIFSYIACSIALLVAKQFALAALLAAAFCFYCCWRSIRFTQTARSNNSQTARSNNFQTARSHNSQTTGTELALQSPDAKTVLRAGKNATTRTEILPADRNATANTNSLESSISTASNRANKIVDSLPPNEPNIALQLKNIEAKAILELKQIAASAISPLQIKSTAQEGATESFFLSFMKELLPTLRTVQGVPFAIPGSKLKYSCDFIVVHLQTGIAADVEIDEPYVATSSRYGLPHHCEDRSLDGNRNLFFVRGNWIVIRFAEEQIALQPAACCKLIASVFASATGDLEIASPLNAVPDLLPVDRWNAKTAGVMAKRDYRQTYLSKAGINLVNSAAACGRNKRHKRHRR